MRNLAALAGALILAGCTTTGDPTPQAAAVGPVVQRGRAVAELRCAACHAINSAGVSPRTNAPSFRTIRVRFSTISWERVMADIAKGGHDEMPAVALDDSDIHALREYLDTLQ